MDIAISKTNFDLGLIRLHRHPAFKDGFPQLEVGNYSDVYEGMEVWTCGFPLGSYLQKKIGTITSSFTKGIISSIIPSPGTSLEHLKGYQLNLTATHGNSGGPVFSPDTGKVYAVLQRGVSDPNGNIVQGITRAEPIYPIFEHDSLSRILGTAVGKIPPLS
jgi:S1-C subfamily serine protease